MGPAVYTLQERLIVKYTTNIVTNALQAYVLLLLLLFYFIIMLYFI